MTTLRVKTGSDTYKGVGLDTLSATFTAVYDWSDDNLPWAYTSKEEFKQGWPSGVVIVPIQTASADFWTNLKNTVNAAGQRCVVELGEAVYHLNKFRVIGSGNTKTYSFGFWFPNLQGLLGQGPDKTFIQLDANATTVDTDGVTDVTAQAHAEMEAMTAASFAPVQRGFCRIDGSPASPVLLGGLTFRAADQLPLNAKGADMPANIYIPQPSPHNGVNLYASAAELGGFVNNVRFQAAARAMYSGPPFECGNAQTGKGIVYWKRCEFDGRRSAAIDPAQPRRCTPVMINGETLSDFTDCWFHHSNLSRYAANDQNRDFSGEYRVTRCKLDHITDTQNGGDPQINNGASLGGWTNATPFGYESSNAKITITDCIVHQDNINPLSGTGQIPMIIQLTSVGNRDPQGGRMYVYGGHYEWVHPQLNGYLGFRISNNTYWSRDGFNTTIFAYHKNGQRLQPHTVPTSVAWPPSASYLAANNLSPETHYLVRPTS